MSIELININDENIDFNLGPLSAQINPFSEYSQPKRDSKIRVVVIGAGKSDAYKLNGLTLKEFTRKDNNNGN